MAISFPLTAPTASISEISIKPNTIVGVTRSPFTGDVEVFAHQGQWWVATVQLALMNREDADTWLSFLLSLNGREGTFIMGDVSKPTPRGEAASTPGTPVVSGASQTGQDINFSGGPLTTTNYLRAGDWVSLGTGTNTRLYSVLTDTNTDGSGDFTLTLYPKITEQNSPGNLDALTVSSAKGLFRLAANSNAWSARPASGVLYTVESFTATSEV